MNNHRYLIGVILGAFLVALLFVVLIVTRSYP